MAQPLTVLTESLIAHAFEGQVVAIDPNRMSMITNLDGLYGVWYDGELVLLTSSHTTAMWLHLSFCGASTR